MQVRTLRTLEDFTGHLISKGFSKDRDGVWKKLTVDRNELSYPESGHAACFQIEDASFWFFHRARMVRVLKKKMAPSGLFFDIGAGNGYMAKELQDAACDTVAVEPGAEGAHHCSQRGVKCTVHGTFQDLQLQNAIPAAGLFDVLEHIQDDLKFLRNLRDSMADDGIIILNVPSFSWLWCGEDDFAGHFRRYDQRQLRDILLASGFDVIYSTYVFSWLIVPYFFLRRLPYVLKGRAIAGNRTTAQNEHAVGSPVLRQILNLSLAFEVGLAKLGLPIPFGTSLMMVGRARRGITS